MGIYIIVILQTQQASHLGVIVCIGLAGIEGDDVAKLSSFEELLLVVDLDILWHDGHATLNDTVLGQLAKVTLQNVVGCRIVVLDRCIAMTGVAGESHHLAVDELIVNLDVVIVDCVIAVECNVELGSNSDVEHECIGSFLVEVYRGLLL